MNAACMTVICFFGTVVDMAHLSVVGPKQAASHGGYHRAPDRGTLACFTSRRKNILDPPAPVDGHQDKLKLLCGSGGNPSHYVPASVELLVRGGRRGDGHHGPGGAAVRGGFDPGQGRRESGQDMAGPAELCSDPQVGSGGGRLRGVDGVEQAEVPGAERERTEPRRDRGRLVPGRQIRGGPGARAGRQRLPAPESGRSPRRAKDRLHRQRRCRRHRLFLRRTRERQRTAPGCFLPQAARPRRDPRAKPPLLPRRPRLSGDPDGDPRPGGLAGRLCRVSCRVPCRMLDGVSRRASFPSVLPCPVPDVAPAVVHGVLPCPVPGDVHAILRADAPAVDVSIRAGAGPEPGLAPAAECLAVPPEAACLAVAAGDGLACAPGSAAVEAGGLAASPVRAARLPPGRRCHRRNHPRSRSARRSRALRGTARRVSKSGTTVGWAVTERSTGSAAALR